MHTFATAKGKRKVAQLVAHYVRDVGVGRSSRLFPTIEKEVFKRLPFFCIHPNPHPKEHTTKNPGSTNVNATGIFFPFRTGRTLQLIPTIPDTKCSNGSSFVECGTAP